MGMARAWKTLENLVLAVVLLVALAAGAGSIIVGRPVAATVVKSGSMYPIYSRGDVALLWNWPGSISVGDVIVFKPAEGSLAGQWTLHRVAGVDEDGRFFTKGDAAEITDQEAGLAGPVSRDEIVAKPFFLGRFPIKIPRLGSLALSIDSSKQGLQRQLLVVALIALVLVAAYEAFRQSTPRRRREALDSRIIFATIGSFVSVLLVAMTMLQTSRIAFTYEVGEQPGVVTGQPIGIVTYGETINRELSKLENKGFMPMVLLVTENDDNITIDADLEVVRPRSQRTVNMVVEGRVGGKFDSLVQLSLVFPLLPPSLIGTLGLTNHWLVALGGCVIPGLIIMLFGFLEPSARRRTARDLRRLRQKAAGILDRSL